ncbi:hypothetical protein KGF56_002619 [Candida oxycetoniae]|uniref:UBR-type domain-containing protein n=1 Tax=Candida oxycetoniae TaxID=497107 RepID=A0AAI9WXY6_9ASCO|nr:uncharacterized protein KGF56_002619 [Candida oxycetoniae]KAI3404574.2 hypothetical protein KGF56_002619 [Candida oxycetoniae]
MSSKELETKSRDSITAVDYINQQMELGKEAREIMPYDPDECTYEMGELRQSVYACLTCSKQNDETPIGVCYSCSIHCHSQHELVELFTKRAFVCDCGTTKMAKTFDGACKLRRKAKHNDSKSLATTPIRSGVGSSSRSRHSSNVTLPAEDIPSSTNIYNQNFYGKFCGCKSFYNPLEETGNMLQCYFGFFCGEDWFHDRCIMGFAPDTFTKPTKVNNPENGENMLDKLSSPGFDAEHDARTVGVGQNSKNNVEHLKEKIDNTKEQAQLEEKDGIDKTKEQDELKENDEIDIDDQEMIEKLKYFPILSSFDQFICWNCVAKFSDVFNELEKQIPGVIIQKLPRFEGVQTVEDWYKLSQNVNEPKPKKVKLENQEEKGKQGESFSIFLANDFKNKLKKALPSLEPSSKLKQFFDSNEYLYNEDPVYQPPVDKSEEEWSTTVSFLDMCTADAIHSLPRSQTIETIQGYDKMREKLRNFFKPFAEQGKVVTEEEVKNFFGKINEDDKKVN